MTEPRDATLRPLRDADDAFAVLRAGPADSEAGQRALLRASDAVEGVLRRHLRGDPSTPMDVRLQALAPDELPPEAMISALRQRDLVSIELAAAFHELLGIRRRVLRGAGPVSRREVEMVLGLAERVEREVVSRPAPIAEQRPAPVPAAVEPAAEEMGPPEREPRRRGRAGYGVPWSWAVLAMVAVLLVSLGIWWAAGGRGSGMGEAIAHFRTGDLQRAEVGFERHLQRNPADATAHLYLARIYRRTGRLALAQDQLRDALAVAPEDAALHRELGFLLLDGGRQDAAVERFRTAVEMEPQAAEGWAGLVRALRESGQTAAADRVLARAPARTRDLLRTGDNPTLP